MKTHFQIYFLIFSLLIAGFSCTVKKRKNETSAVGKFYHNTTSYYNGYWNAKEILRESMILMREANVDDYNQILEVEDYVTLNNPKMLKADMDKIIQKVTTVAQLHEPGDWVDDCYVMMGKAQYLKQEYETAEETLEYFQEDFNPGNPYGRNYKSKKPSGKKARKLKAVEKKEKEIEKKKAAKEKANLKKEKEKSREQLRKEKEKQKKAERKAKEKQKKIDARNKKKGIKKTTSVEKTQKSITEPFKTEKSNLPDPIMKSPVDEPYVPPVPKKPEEDKTAYHEGLLWLAKTYIKRENWFPAQLILEKISASGAHEDIKKEIPATFANLYLKQKRYDEALVKLSEAINVENSRQLRARYAFISGQIHQMRGDYNLAFENFAQAQKWSLNSQMEFMAELAISKTGIASGKISREQVTEDLLKMVRREKYKGMNDQIYFTLAEIEISQNNDNKAIEYFGLSALNNTNNKKLKSEAYFMIGELNYKNQKYLEARNYYDSTLMVMAKEDSRYPLTKKYVDNLKDIANNIESIRYGDTLLYFANLTGEDQKKQVTDYILGNRVKESAPQTSGNLVSKNISAKLGVVKNSHFFAYDKKVVEKGIENFKKDWGQIALEDNWRRSMKASSNGLTSEESEEKSDKPEEKPLVSQDEYDKFMREVPSNPIRKKEIEDNIMLSMFALGKLFRDKVNNYKNSAQTLEGMHNRFGATPYELDSYYYLYLDYLDLENAAKAEDYKNRIIKKFPESTYALILKDPAYLTKIQQEGSSAEKYYKKVYQMFESEQYDKVIQAVNQAPSVLVADNTYDARMALLKAMSLGSIQGREAYINGLNEVITGYPGSPEHLKAKEILRFLGGDNSAFANVQDVDKIFSRDPSTLHYVAVTTYDWPETDLINFKIAISEYNKQNFKVERLQLGDASLNIQENIQIILIRKFENEEKSIEYYKKVMKDIQTFSGGTDRSFDVLPISQNNYRKMISQYSTQSYRAFLEQVVLPNQSK